MVHDIELPSLLSQIDRVVVIAADVFFAVAERPREWIGVADVVAPFEGFDRRAGVEGAGPNKAAVSGLRIPVVILVGFLKIAAEDGRDLARLDFPPSGHGPVAAAVAAWAVPLKGDINRGRGLVSEFEPRKSIAGAHGNGRRDQEKGKNWFFEHRHAPCHLRLA